MDPPRDALAETDDVALPATGDELRRTLPDDDPYAALGVRVGRFILYSSLASTIGYTTNAAATGGGAGAAFVRIAPELIAESDWLRHAAALRLRASYGRFLDGTTTDDLSASAETTARIDIADLWTGDLSVTYDYDQQSVTDPDFPTGVDGRPGVHGLRGTAALNGGAGRLRMTIAGSLDRTMYEDGSSGGVVVDQGDRTNTLASARLRLGYRAAGSLTPFVEAEISRRVYDRAVDNDGLRRASVGQAYRAGLAFDRGPVLSGEVAIGTARTDFDDGALPSLSVLTFEGSLIWSPTDLTTVTIIAATSIAPSASVTSSGSIAHDASVDLAYAWKPNFSLNWSAGFGHQRFQGTGRVDLRADAGVEAVWKLNRSVHVTAGYLHEWLDSSEAGRGYQADTARLEVQLQR